MMPVVVGTAVLISWIQFVPPTQQQLAKALKDRKKSLNVDCTVCGDDCYMPDVCVITCEGNG